MSNKSLLAGGLPKKINEKWKHVLVKQNQSKKNESTKCHRDKSISTSLETIAHYLNFLKKIKQICKNRNCRKSQFHRSAWNKNEFCANTYGEKYLDFCSTLLLLIEIYLSGFHILPIIYIFLNLNWENC